MGTELPGEKTAMTTGVNAVIAGFFSASTLWPNLHVTEEMRERAVEALVRMEALHLAERLVGEMSAGEKRRILIARALAHRPRQLLLDEPSNALDLAAQRELRETLRRLAREGTGLVLVTHHLSDILPEIERVILMHGGRILGDGPREELLTETRLSELFNTPVRIGRDEEWLQAGCDRTYVMRNAPGIPSSRVARTALLAIASCTRWPSVVCFGVFTHAGRAEMSIASGRNSSGKVLHDFSSINSDLACVTFML
jgi:ABC-type cobalamin/Fe3+-siderophores transport system ATPase subunit